ncbi:MAG: phosphoribosylformylglycinamidine synthase subunit PurS [Myxococcales bacterium]|nr:phosphoribosylformylglycinamidine synthase subunit PurS [Myxococcales bacterium]
MQAKVLVTLRAGVLDPAGEAVADGLRQLGFDEVRSVRVGKVIEVELDDEIDASLAKERLGQMAGQLLANLVIEDYDIEFVESPPDKDAGPSGCA